MKNYRMLPSRLLLALLLLAAIVTNAPLLRAQNPAQASGAPAQSSATVLPQGVERVTSVEGITEYRLQNGLRVLLSPDMTKPTTTVNITYMVGSRNENYGETGMAHLLEHMMFKGTPKHKNVPQELTEHGARPNGTTWLDRTNYYETFAATDENLNWALELESDRMINSFIARRDLDSEMTVVRNEYERGENSPVNIMIERMMSTAFLWHNYGHSTIGARSDIENVPIERLQTFYHNYYQPDNAILLVAGKFDESKTLGLIQKYFGAIQRPARVIQKTYTSEPTQDGEREVTLRRVGDVQAVGVVYHVPACSHQDFAAIDVLNHILTADTTGRLYKALVESHKATSVFGLNYQQREPGAAIFGAEVRQDTSLDAARDALIQTVENFSATPPTREEVERARTSLLKNIDLTLNNSERVGLELSEWMAMGDWRLFFIHRDRIRKVTPEDVQRVASQYFKPSNRTLGLFIPTARPDRAEIPPTPDVNAMVNNYHGEAAVASGEAFDPSPTNIESRTVRNAAPNGMKIALLSKKTRGQTVIATMTLRFGDAQSLMNRSAAATLAGQMLMRGTTKHTRQQLHDEFDRLKARVVVVGGATQALVSIETTRENFGEVLKLVAEVLREPAFPANEFELLKQEVLTNLESQKSEPRFVTATAFNRHVNPYPKGDVRYTPTYDEEVADLRAATLDDVKKFYTDFYGASDAQLAVVGDFDAQEISKLATDLFGSWKSPKKFARVESVYTAVPALNQSFNTPDKANASFIAGLNMNVRDDDPDYPALVLGNYMLGGGFLNSRLATRIRQREGLSYSVGSSLFISPLDRYGSFTTFAIYAPQNVERLEAAFREEIQRALSEGFSAEEVAAAKSGFLQTQQVNRAQDSALARRLSAYLFLGRTLNWDAEFEQKIAALTPDQILGAMRRHIDPTKIVIIKAGDFQAHPPGPAAPAATPAARPNP